MGPMLTGPNKPLSSNRKTLNSLQYTRSAGMAPSNSFSAKSKCSRATMLPMSPGIFPDRALPRKFRTTHVRSTAKPLGPGSGPSKPCRTNSSLHTVPSTQVTPLLGLNSRSFPHSFSRDDTLSSSCSSRFNFGGGGRQPSSATQRPSRPPVLPQNSRSPTTCLSSGHSRASQGSHHGGRSTSAAVDFDAIEAVGDADRDADRPRLLDDLPEEAEPDRALREPCGDGVRRRLRELRPDEAEPERPESVRRRRRVGVRGGVDMGAAVFGQCRAVLGAESWSGRGSAYVNVLDALYGSVATRGLPSAGAGAAQGRVLPALSWRIWPCNAPGAAAGLRISIKEVPTRRLGAARVDRADRSPGAGLPTRLAGTGS